MWLPSVITSTPAANSSSAFFGRDADAAGRVLAVDDDEVGRELLAQPGQQLAQRAAPARRRRRRRRGSPRCRTRDQLSASRRHTARAQRRAGLRGRRAAGGQDAPSRRHRRRRRRASSRSSCRAGSSWSCCRWRSSARGRWRARPGRSLLLFIIAGLIALLLNPFVHASCGARASRAARRSSSCTCRCCWRRHRHRRAAREPGRRPGRRRSSDNVPRIVDDANGIARRTSRTGSTATGINLQVKKQGKTALQTLGDRIAEGSGDARERSRATRCRRSSRASLALILIIVLIVYMLLYGERIGDGGARRRAAGRRHAGGRLPDAHAGARCSATSAASCCSA